MPPQNVEAMIAEATALGRQVSRLQNTDDVTDRVTDLETRIVTAQQSVDRVQRLLIEATDLGEVVLLEGELTTRQTMLETLLAEQRNLGNRTALATLTSTCRPHRSSTTVEPAVEPRPDDDGIGDAFAKGGRAFVTAVAAVLIFIGYTAPFLAIALVIGGDRLAGQSSPGATKSISCSTAPTSSGRRSANDRTRFRRCGQKLTGSAPRAAQMPSFHG